MADKKSFVFYHKWGELLEDLPADDVKGIVLALIDYSECSTVPAQLSQMANQTFKCIRQQIDEDTQKWESTCKRNSENIKKRWDKSGNTKNTTVYDRTKSYKKNTKNTDNECEYECDNDNDNECDCVCSVAEAAENTTTQEDEENILYGRYAKFTEKQYAELVADFGSDTLGEYIERLDNYVDSIIPSGKTPFKNHYRTIVGWLTKDGKKKINANAHSYDLDKLMEHVINHTPKIE